MSRVERLAKLLYETMVRRALPEGDPSICAWEVQPDILKEDWRAVAETALSRWGASIKID